MKHGQEGLLSVFFILVKYPLHFPAGYDRIFLRGNRSNRQGEGGA